MYVGPKAQAEDWRPSEKGETLSKEPMLVHDKASLGHTSARRHAEDKCYLGHIKPRSKQAVYHPEGRSQKFYRHR